MQRTGPYSYEVRQGEQVTFDIVAYGTSKLVKMALDGKKLEPFSLEATYPPGKEHKVSTDFDFSPPSTANPDDDHYEIAVEGSGGGRYEETPIFRNDPIHDPDFTFLVVK